jgi:flagellar biosynthesis/type III secretory pathway chaperone
MNHLVQNLVEALREELKEYGEMLALLDQQQELVLRRQAQDLFVSTSGVNAQAEAIAAARNEREQRQRHVARQLGLPDDAPFAAIVPQLPPDYRPLVNALVQENNELLIRVQQRARQNHVLLSRVVELMQRFIGTLFPGAANPTYNDTGRMFAAGLPQTSLYNAIG